MPLAYTTREPLNIPPAEFNDDGIATLILRGGRYGGAWVIDAGPVRGPESNCYGQFETEVVAELLDDPAYHDRALETCFIWAIDETRQRGLRLLAWKRQTYPNPSDRAFFCAATIVIGNDRFVPVQGVAYADELTLDQAMA